ncbi:MAG TPA: cytochrome c peroxidase [Gemmatimonadales bacterium]|nr:cytochrome c peroxidase [Gemmatimonadales bacterium]
MMRIERRHLVLATALLLGACSSGDDSPAPEPSYPAIEAALTIDPGALANYSRPVLPAYLTAAIAAGFDNTPADNPITDAGATVGRVLFYDTHLSTTSTVSCATCHAPAIGFTDADRFSGGVAPPAVTPAHSMRIVNARFYPGLSFFWDKRAPTLEQQVVEPITNAVEMGFDDAAGGIAAATAQLQAQAYMRELMQLAYGDSTVTTLRVQRSLAQFMRSIVATGSRFDAGLAQVGNVGQPFPNFSAAENRGKQLFLQPPNQGGPGCAGCHAPPTFALVANAQSNGLDAGETRIFKSPSLMNVAQSGPYMHDGRFADLAAVVEHYDGGVQDGPALDQRLRAPGGAVRRLNLTADDKAALVAFLQTLTDATLAGDARFTDPFRR